MSEITKRTRIGRPSSDSSERNSPRPSANAPTAGGLIPPRTLAVWRLQRREAASYSRRLNAWIRPAEPETSSSTRLARPSQTGRTTVVPRYSTHSSDRSAGSRVVYSSVVHEPISKSKSCCPSRVGSLVIQPARRGSRGSRPRRVATHRGCSGSAPAGSRARDHPSAGPRPSSRRRAGRRRAA